MSFLSFIGKTASKKRSVRALETAEEKARRFFTPSDWLIIGIFFIIMTLGAATMFVVASNELSSEVPVHGGTYVEGVVGNPRFINPLLAISDIDNDLTFLLFAGLMKSEPDGSLSPHLAKSVEVSEDGLQYTFTLKENIFFHDDTPITAEDVVFTVQAAKNPEIKSPRRANWEGVEVIALDDRTVSFSLRAPYALFLENTTLGILPSHIWKNIRTEEIPFSDLNTNPVGSGIYKTKTVKKSSAGVPTEYRLIAASNGLPKPYIKNFIFKLFPNTDAVVSAISSGDVDAAHSILPLYNGRPLENSEAIFARVFGVFFNQNQQDLFADATVRKALDSALDKKTIVDTVIGGYGTVLDGPLPPQSVFQENEGQQPTAESRIATAREILENDGWKLGENGVFEKTTKNETRTLRFTLSTANASELKQAAEMVAEQWRALGADVSTAFFDQNDLQLQVIRPREYDALLFGLVVGRELDLFAFWHSSQRNDPGLNIGLYANITTDKYLEDARNEFDPVARREYALQAAEEISRETAAIFLYAPHFTYVYTNKLKGVEVTFVSTPRDRFFGIENWYLRTERVWPFFTNMNEKKYNNLFSFFLDTNQKNLPNIFTTNN